MKMAEFYLEKGDQRYSTWGFNTADKCAVEYEQGVGYTDVNVDNGAQRRVKHGSELWSADSGSPTHERIAYSVET